MNTAGEEDLARIRRICSRFPEAAEDLIQDRAMFHVRRRRIAIYNSADAPYRKRWEGCGRSIHFATDPADRDSFDSDARFFISPHHGFRGWRGLKLDGTTNWEELAELLRKAYLHVANKSLIQQMQGE